MSNYCPEWIYSISCALTAKEFLSSENSLNSIARKFSVGLSEKYSEIKFEEISECAEHILQFLSELEANDKAVDYIDDYVYRRVSFTSSGSERKISGMFSSDLNPTKNVEYKNKETVKIFRATIFRIRNGQIDQMPAGWQISDVQDLEWYKDLTDKETNILDNF